MQQVTRTRETKNYADGGLISTIKEKLFGPSGPPETITQKYARQDAERAAKSPAAAAMAAPPAAAPAPSSAIGSYAGGMQSTMQRREAAAGLKDGGQVKAKPITGPGTGTSDSIPRNMRPGSYVMPTDSTKKTGGTVPVNVSNGESEFTPEQVHAVGAKVLDMVKGATHKPVHKPKSRAARQLADGGLARPVMRGFANGGDIPLDAQATNDRKTIGGAASALSDMNTRAGAAIADVATMIPRGLAGAYDTAVVRPMRAAGINAAYTSPMVSPAGADPASQTPFYDQLRARDAVGAGRGTVNPAPVNPAPVNPAPINPAPINPMAAMPTVQAGPTTSAAGAGRGTVNPGTDMNTVTGQPIPAAVTLAGQTGTAVDGAAGVSKFRTGDGRTLYSNVTGNDNNVLMSGKPGIQTVPAAGGGAAAAMSSGGPGNVAGIEARASQIYKDMAQINQGYDQPGVLSNGPGMRVVGTTNGLFRAANDPGTPSLSTMGAGAVSGREQARLANARAIAGDQNATSRMNNQDSVAAQLAGQQSSTAASRYSVDTQGKTAAQRLAMDANVHSQDAPLKASAVTLAKQTDAARSAVLTAKTPEQKAAAEETLRTLQGKNDPPELYSTAALPGSVDALGNKTPGGAIVTNKRTGETRIIYGNELQQPAATAMPAGLVVGAATKQADGVYDGPSGKKVTIKAGKVTGIQ
jgi:hypothetical protein